ncbi:MAG: hypothetical protein R6X17_03975 [Candidatus Competibacteraceae bacterium]
MNSLTEFPSVTPQGHTAARYGIKRLIISIFFIIFAGSPVNASRTDSEPITVCGITLNSDNEFKAMSRALGPIASSVELVQYRKPDGQIEFEPEQWLDKTCNSTVGCDVVVISGHFDGIFGHENLPVLLPLTTLERGACSNNCTGIFQNAKEVYLLGCQSLMTDDDQGKSLSLDNPFARFQSSYRDRMRRLFPNAGWIYGYTATGPSGSAFETRFYQSILKQRRHFASLKEPNPMGLLKPSPYTVSPLVFTFGANFSDETRIDRERFCRAIDQDSSTDKYRAYLELLLQTNGHNYLYSLLESINKKNSDVIFLMKASAEFPLSLRQQLLEWSQSDTPIAIQMMAHQLSQHLNLISQSTLNRRQIEVLRDMEIMQGNVYEKANAVCFAGQVISQLSALFKPGILIDDQSDLAMQLVACLYPKDPQWIKILIPISQQDPLNYRRNLAQQILTRIKAPLP